MVPSSFNRVTVDLSALEHNFRYLKKAGAGREFLAMVKADAYGHDMVRCAQTLKKSGCTIFGVAELCEAVKLRQSGISGVIFAMIGFDEADTQTLLEHDITPVIYDIKSLQALSSCAVRLKKEVAVHVKVDTGMSRLGVDLEQIDDLLEALDKMPCLHLGGVASHFPSADDRQSSSTKECLAKFAQFQSRVKKQNKITYHIANSGGTLYFPESRHDMIRCGISLYGYYPDGRDKGEHSDLLPVMSFATRVLQVKEVKAGTGVSYGSTYVTGRRTRLAVLPVGYEDGFSRQLSNCGEVLIHGKRAPVRGRVCMNMCMVDVTEIEGVRAGDTAVLLGRQGNDIITADEIAARIGTISYEVLCMIGNNNEREFI